MSVVETNLFPITNLSELKCNYRLYQIKGLSKDQDEYEINRQTIIQKLSNTLQSPVTVIEHQGEPHLVVQEGSKEPPASFMLVRTNVLFEKTPDTFTLDYEHLTPQTQPIAVRFLQFAIQGALFRNHDLWQPGAGRPFFTRQPCAEKEGVSIYRGYSVRVVSLDQARIAVCVDVKFRYVSKLPLPAHLSRENFRPYKGENFVYHYGTSWYEIKLIDHSGVNVTQQLIPDNGKNVPLIKYVHDHAHKPLPKEVVELPQDCVVVTFMTSRNETRSAPAALCYQVFETNDPRIKRLHRESILEPYLRREHIHAFVKNALTNLRYNAMPIRVNPAPITAPSKVFSPPDLAFGNNHIISVRNTPGAQYVAPDKLGQARLSALLNKDIGPHARKLLEQQYFIMPKSIADSYGPAFIADLNKTVNELYPQEIPYAPTIITYDDLGVKTFATQGKAILAAIDQVPRQPGYGIVMVHDTTDRKNREHDTLAAMVMHKLRERGLYVSVIHTTIARESYALPQNTAKGSPYQQIPEKQGKLRGYLRNVTFSKILLTNERWPFILATPLHADLTIAIDVYHNTSCFTLLGKNGDVRVEHRTSRQKERLSRAYVKTILLDILRDEHRLGRTGIKTIVIQRDGRLFDHEIKGINDAIVTLKDESILPRDLSLNLIEIPKSGMASFRLFNVDNRAGRDYTENPNVGTAYTLNPQEGYVSTTGREYLRNGTADPLHIKLISGTMPFEHILEDIYAQTCLAWTSPGGCTREPITIKLGDIRLQENAAAYDDDQLEYEETKEDDEHE